MGMGVEAVKRRYSWFGSDSGLVGFGDKSGLRLRLGGRRLRASVGGCGRGDFGGSVGRGSTE